jgi:hypothetical protein
MSIAEVVCRIGLGIAGVVAIAVAAVLMLYLLVLALDAYDAIKDPSRRWQAVAWIAVIGAVVTFAILIPNEWVAQ